jgi:two-component system cell cycle sensor histidine kinase/response regulator CckA
MPSYDSPAVMSEPFRSEALRATDLYRPGADEVLDRLTRLAARAVGAPVALLLLIDGDRVLCKSTHGLSEPFPEPEHPLSRSICQLLSDSSAPLRIRDLRDPPQAEALRSLVEAGQVACLAVPLRTGAGEVLGGLCLLESTPRDWQDPELEAALDLADAAVDELWRRLESLRALESARRREQRFRSLIESTADVVAVLTAGGTLDYVTPSVARMLGYAPEQLVGTNVFSLVHPENAAEVVGGFSRVLRAGGCEGTLEFRVRHQDGSWRTLESRASNLLTDPAVAGVVVSSRDVTDERLAEQTQRRLNAFLEATPDFVATFDPHGRALSINRAFRRTVEIEDGDTLSTVNLSDLFPHHVLERILHEGIPTAIREGVWFGETSLQGADGLIPISQVILAHKSPSGAVEFLSTLGRDISERKEAEAALRRSEEHFRALIENSADIIAILDAGGTIRYESPSVERVLGYRPGEMRGRDIMDLVHPDDRALAAERLHELVTGTGDVGVVQLRVRHKDESWRQFELTAQNLLDNPAVAGIVINSRDITDRTRAEDALRDSQEQLLQSQKMEAVGRLAGGVAHDFNNLLTAIKGFTELLLLDFDERDPRRPFATEIQSAANRAAGLTRQLLAFSRKQVLQPKVMDLNESMVDMEKMLRRLIGEDVELVVTDLRSTGRVQADPGQIEQVLLNLAVNARDAMPGGGRLVVETGDVELEDGELPRHWNIRPGPYVQLTVSDTGSGMGKEVQERVFEPFFTTKEQGKGTGLGLSTVYGIVKQSGGYIDVESEPGQGTTFRVLLPRVEAPVEQRVARDTAGPVSGSETVLVVEDEAAVRVLIRRVLSRNGYHVLEAESGPAALRVLQRHGEPVDLLLTDVVMPGMSGRELADQLTAARPELHVLYMSGYTDEAIVHHGVLDPGVAFLEKPFTPDVLLRRLREVLGTPVDAAAS